MHPISACLVCASIAVSGLTVGAQAPSRWADLTVPTGVLASGVSVLGKLVVYRNGSFLRVFSAVTGRFDPMPASAGTTPVLKPDMLLVPESDRWTAYSAWRGTSAVQMVNFSIGNIVAKDSVATVFDGAQVHVYSAFTGNWVTRSRPAGWGVITGNRVVVMADTTNFPCTGASAFDAYRGQWHDLPAQSARLQSFGSAGSTAILDFLSFHMAFSALHPNWVRFQSSARQSSTQDNSDADFVLSRGILFSGLRGTFNASPVPTPQVGQHVVVDMIGWAWNGTREWVCGPVDDTWTQLPAGAFVFNLHPPVGAVALYQSGGQAWAYSAATGTTANSGVASGGYGSGAVSGATAATTDAGTNRPIVYSALTGQWHTPPVNAGNGLPWVSQSGAMLRMANGAIGFSSHTGQFVPVQSPGMTLLGGLQRGVLAAQDSSAVYVFDGRLARWQSLLLDTAAAQVEIRDNVLLAADGSRVIGFGEGSGRLQSLTLPEPSLQLWAADDVGVVRTGNHLLAFAGLPDSLSWSNFPSGNSATGTGTPLFHQLWLPGGSIAILGLGPRAASVTSSPFGELWLDLAATSTYFLMAATGQERALMTLPIPDLQGLRNSEWLLQALVLPPSGQAYFGDPAVLRVL